MHRFLFLLLIPALTYSQLIEAEYFLDIDPGEGLGIPLTAYDGSFGDSTEAVSFDLQTDSLSLGVHWIYTRFKDSTGTWGLPRARMVTVSNPSPVTTLFIAAAKYYFGSDLGTGYSMYAVDFFDSTEEDVYAYHYTDANFPIGSVSVQVRMKNNHGYWGFASIAAPIEVSDSFAPEIQFIYPTDSLVFGIGSPQILQYTATDNVGIENILLDYISTGAWTHINTYLPSVYNPTKINGTFDWIIPNEPTDNATLRAIVNDAAGYSDTSFVNNLSFAIVYPTMSSYSPTSEIINWTQKEFNFRFSQFLDTSIDFENAINIESNHSGAISKTISYDEDSLSINIQFDKSLASKDTVTITLDADSISNIYNYHLDGDGDGVEGGDIIITYYTMLHADYDTSESIDAIDLTYLLDGLENKIYDYELGPFEGERPHLIADLDGVFNIDDVMAFVAMWNWQTDQGGLLRQFADMGNPIELETNEDSIYFDLPAGVIAYEVQIQHDPESITFGTVNSNGSVKIQDTDVELGLFNLICSPKEETRVVIPINISEEADITISIRTIGFDHTIISQQTKKMTIENIPDKFALHYNYPNPFNPETTIRYDLPLGTDIHLVVFDILGREVRTLVNEKQEAGFKSVRWNGRNDMGQTVSAGMYFYRIRAGKFSKVQKMVLLK